MTPKPEVMYPLDMHGWFRWHEALGNLLDEHRPRTVVEVGSWMGCSSAFIAGKIRAWGGRLICVDTWKPGWYDEPNVNARAETGFDRFCSNMYHLGLTNIVTPIRARSKEVFWPSDVDFAFIDGSHEYKDVQEDLTSVWPAIRSGGVVVGDDYGMPGVEKAWSEFFKRDFRVLPNNNVEGQLVWLVK